MSMPGTTTINRAAYDCLLEQHFPAVYARKAKAPAGPVTTHRQPEPARPECCAVVDATSPENFSSGVLIADRLVLAAAHSVPDSCVVRIGASNIANGTAIPVAGKPIRCDIAKNRIAQDPPRGFGGTVDLALLVLREPAKAVPARLATYDDFVRAQKSKIKMTGFGYRRDRFGNLTDAGIKRTIVLPFQPGPAPEDPSFSARYEFVAGGMVGKQIFDAEEGDSGAPAYIETKSSILVIGIDSRNAAAHKSIFTRVDAVLDWIRDTAREYGIVLDGAATAAKR